MFTTKHQEYKMFVVIKDTYFFIYKKYTIDTAYEIYTTVQFLPTPPSFCSLYSILVTKVLWYSDKWF
jgi:hypothetical protein